MANVDKIQVGTGASSTTYNIEGFCKVYDTIAEMNADIANIPNGCMVYVKENSPSGLEGDSALSDSSTNWVQNKVVKKAIDGINTSRILSTKTTTKPLYNTFVAKTWNGLTSFSGTGIWTDGDNVYYSSGSDQYVLNKKTSTWETKTWNGYEYIYGADVWHYGNDIYYTKTTDGNYSYKLNKSTGTWSGYTWYGSMSYFDGRYIWTDGDNIYYSKGSGKQYVLDTGSWTAKTWSGLTGIYGNNIWTDGDNIYYSSGSSQYVLNKSNGTWTEKTWISLTYFNGKDIWTDGKEIYYSYSNNQYVLDKSSNTWVEKSWGLMNNPTGEFVWTDGNETYFSATTTHKVLTKNREINHEFEYARDINQISALSDQAAYISNPTSTPNIQDPILHQTDIATTQQDRSDKAAAASVAYALNTNLGDPSSASAVSGASAFAKINSLNGGLATNKIYKVELQFTVSANAGRGFLEIPIANCTWVGGVALPNNAIILSQTWSSNHIGRDGAAGNSIFNAVVARSNGAVTAVYVIYDYKSTSSLPDFTLSILYKLP